MAPGLRELIALPPLAGLGCGLALAHGDLLFVAFYQRPATQRAGTVRFSPGRARLATGLAESLADAVCLLRHARQSFEMARCLGRSKLDRPLVPLTGLTYV